MLSVGSFPPLAAGSGSASMVPLCSGSKCVQQLLSLELGGVESTVSVQQSERHTLVRPGEAFRRRSHSLHRSQNKSLSSTLKGDIDGIRAEELPSYVKIYAAVFIKDAQNDDVRVLYNLTSHLQ